MHTKFIYGGPGWQEEALANVVVEPASAYGADINGKKIDFILAPAFTPSAEIGTNEVVIPATGDWPITWENIPNLDDDLAMHFVVTVFSRFDGGGSAMWICPPNFAEPDGSLTIPASLIETLPDRGLIHQGRWTHWMENFNGRRLDVITIWGYVSTYRKQ